MNRYGPAERTWHSMPRGATFHCLPPYGMSDPVPLLTYSPPPTHHPRVAPARAALRSSARPPVSAYPPTSPTCVRHSLSPPTRSLDSRAGSVSSFGRSGHRKSRVPSPPAVRQTDVSLGRRITSFLKKSDHSLDRFCRLIHSRSSSGIGTSSSATRESSSPAAAFTKPFSASPSITEEDRMSSSSSEEDLLEDEQDDGIGSEEFLDRDNDTSAEISKLDLAFAGDDELESQVVVRGEQHPAARGASTLTNGLAGPPSQALGLPSGPPPAHRMGNSLPQSGLHHESPPSSVGGPQTSSLPQSKSPSSHLLLLPKKYHAPQPPGAAGAPLRKGSQISTDSFRSDVHSVTRHSNGSGSLVASSRSSARSSFGTPCGSTQDTGTLKVGAAAAGTRRQPSFKKYPAPQPPGVSQKPHGPAIDDPTLVPNGPEGRLCGTDTSLTCDDSSLRHSENVALSRKSSSEDDLTRRPPPSHGLVHDLRDQSTCAGCEASKLSSSSSSLPVTSPFLETSVPSASFSSVACASQLVERQGGCDEAWKSSSFRDRSTIESDMVVDDANPKSETSASSMDSKGNKQSVDDGPKKVKKRKLASSLTNVFEESKASPKSPLTPKTGKVRKLGSLASKFENDGSSSGSTATASNAKLKSPYSKPFEPEMKPLDLKSRKSIGGVNVSVFGAICKPSKDLIASAKGSNISRRESSVVFNEENVDAKELCNNNLEEKQEEMDSQDIKECESAKDEVKQSGIVGEVEPISQEEEHSQKEEDFEKTMDAAEISVVSKTDAHPVCNSHGDISTVKSSSPAPNDSCELKNRNTEAVVSEELDRALVRDAGIDADKEECPPSKSSILGHPAEVSLSLDPTPLETKTSNLLAEQKSVHSEGLPSVSAETPPESTLIQVPRLSPTPPADPEGGLLSAPATSPDSAQISGTPAMPSSGVSQVSLSHDAASPDLTQLSRASGATSDLKQVSRVPDSREETSPAAEDLPEIISNFPLRRPLSMAEIDEVLSAASQVLNSCEALAGSAESLEDHSPPEAHHSTSKSTPTEEEEVFMDAVDASHLDILMPLPDPDEIRSRDSRSRSVTPLEGGRRRSVTPNRIVAQTELLLSETDRLLRNSRSCNSLRRSLTRSLSGVASGKCEMERMSASKEKLELERLALRNEMMHQVELNGDVSDADGGDGSLYRRKYEWSLREVDLLKKQLKQQQEDALDQQLILKKQLEKKVCDAHEETDEQRQVVSQLKRKCQRLQAEMNDLKILLEEQSSRNNLLEKKQRKFDQDMQSVHEELRGERLSKEKIQRERDQTLSEKYSFEQEVAALKLDLDLKSERIASLTKELDDLQFTGKVEEEVAVLKKTKHELELRVKDQEEELDDLAGQVQMLEAAKVRLEMSLEQMRKESKREASQRDEELEEVRISAQKKVKALEAQLEGEHDERTQLVREKHELERRLADAHERTFAAVEDDHVHRLKKELKKTKALLRDAQTMLEKTRSEGGSKVLLRQLKTQLEDAEFAKAAALKARQSAEADLSELQSQLEEVLRFKKESEDRCAKIAKEKAELQTQIEEGEEEVAEVMKKYKATVSQLSVDQISLSEQSQLIAELEHEKQVLHDRLAELSSKVEVLEGETANIHTQRRLEMKVKEVESKLELEQTTRQRLESQVSRLKDQVERLSGDCDMARLKEAQAADHSKKLGRQLREAKEDLCSVQQKHLDVSSKKQEVEKQLELSESEVMTLKSDLKLAFKRIEDLQQALQGDMSDSDSDVSDRSENRLSPGSEAMSVISEDSEDLLPTRESYA